MGEGVPLDCQIRFAGKHRNGKDRYWCSVHRSDASSGDGRPPCRGALGTVRSMKVLDIDPSDYPGGVALWGAVAPVYDSTKLPLETGIHVHARPEAGSAKGIDDTFDVVHLIGAGTEHNSPTVTVTSDAAISYYLSRFQNRDVVSLRCPLCNEAHLDSDVFAISPHRRHLCYGCGFYFYDKQRSVSNPLAAVEGTQQSKRLRRRPDRTLDIRQVDFPGGIQVWASNPALLWTADRPEEEGLHLHAFAGTGEILLDETYALVKIDGKLLSEAQIQYLMVQQCLSNLQGRIVSARCPTCSEMHFDVGDLAFRAHDSHECSHCGRSFVVPGRLRTVVSNPFVAFRNRLAAAVAMR
jgi:hypothetical protein